MANVLPRDVKKRVAAEYRARIIIAASLVALILALPAGVALLPSYLAIRMAAPSTSSTEGERAASEDTMAVARAVALMLRLDETVAASSSPTALIQSALAERPRGVTVERVSLASGEKSTMIIAGTASREGVSAFRDNLEATAPFKKVEVPVGALVGSERTSFSFTVTGDF
jgi:hypothetical protein